MAQKETMQHCNKFYPFISKQFAVHHPELYNVISSLWRDIADEDGEVVSVMQFVGVPGHSIPQSLIA